MLAMVKRINGAFSFAIVLAITLLACALLAGCSSGEQKAEENPLSIEGAYHPLTGMDEPEYYAGTEDYEVAVTNSKANEANSDTKRVFVAVSLDADDKENLTVAKAQRMGAGDSVSTAKLVIDDTNTYNDYWALNNNSEFKQLYVSGLKELGYGDGTENVTLYGGSDDQYKAVFVFFVSNNDLENGETARLTWEDREAEFNLEDVKEVDSPLVMVKDLKNSDS